MASSSSPPAPQQEHKAETDSVRISFDEEDGQTTAMASASASETTASGSTAAAVPPKDLVASARSAFKHGDADASRLVHEQKMKSLAPEKHGGVGSDVIKSIVFGGLDGIITTFSVVAAVAGSGLGIKLLILMGVANLVGDGISMGVGDFLSSKAEMDHILQERAREQWEWENFPEGEKEEMVDLYVEKGFDREDAELIINTYTKKPEYISAFIDHMVVMELGYMVPDGDENPAKDGLVTFLSFCAFGSVPIWLYIFFYAAGYSDAEGWMFGVACAVTAATLFGLGFVKARITNGPMLKSGTLMMINGALAAAAAFSIGYLFDQTLGVDGC